MNYSCQEEYEACMGGAGEAEAAAGYEEYLSQLLTDGQYYLWALEVAQDLVSSQAFKKSGLTAEGYVLKVKSDYMESLKPKPVEKLTPTGKCFGCGKDCSPTEYECPECLELPF